jgi:hypothetical protein
MHSAKDDAIMKELNILPYRFSSLKEYLGYLESRV